MSRSHSIFGSVATNFDSLNEPVGVAVFVVCGCCCCCCCWFLLFCLSGACYRILAGGILLLVSNAVGLVCLLGSSLRISSSGCTDFHFASCLVPLSLSCMIALAVALATVQFRFLSFLAISFVVTWLKALGASRKKKGSRIGWRDSGATFPGESLVVCRYGLRVPP